VPDGQAAKPPKRDFRELKNLKDCSLTLASTPSSPESLFYLGKQLLDFFLWCLRDKIANNRLPLLRKLLQQLVQEVLRS